MTTSQTLRCTAALLASCLVPGVAATASFATTPTVTANTTTADLKVEDAASLTVVPQLVTVPKDGTATVQVYGGLRSPEPEWVPGSFTVSKAPAGITARFIRDGRPNESNSGTLSFTHTGKTNAAVGAVEVTVNFGGPHVVTKTVTINLPEGHGNGEPPNGPREYNGPINRELISSTGGRIESTYVDAKAVRVTVDLKHRCAERVKLTVTTPDGRKNVLKHARHTNRCSTWDGARSASYRMRSQSKGTWGFSAKASGDQDGWMNNWKLEFDHR